MNAACSPSGWWWDSQRESRGSAGGEEESLGCGCLKAAKSAACWELEGPHLPLPRAAQSSALSPDARVQALLLPALRVVSHAGPCSYIELGFCIWSVADLLERKEMLGSWLLLPFGGEGTGCPTPWPSVAFPSCGVGRRWTHAGSSVLLKPDFNWHTLEK